MIDFVDSSVNLNFVNSSTTFKASPVKPDQLFSPYVPGAMISVSSSPQIQDQFQFTKGRKTYIINLNCSNRSKSFKRSKSSNFVYPTCLIAPNRSNGPNGQISWV